MSRKTWFKSLVRRLSKATDAKNRQVRWRSIELLEDRLAPASASLVAGNLQLNYAAANESVSMANDGANITLTGAATGTFPTANVTQFSATDPTSASGQTLTLAAGTTLNLTGGFSSTGVETVSLNSGISTSALSITAGAVNSSATGTIAVSTGATFNVTGANGALNGVISGAGSVTKAGAGTLTVGGTNTYTGATNVSGGILKLAATTAPTSVTYPFFRFQMQTPWVRTPSGANSVQYSELQFFNAGVQVDATGASATNPGGDNPAAEMAPNVLDNNLSTKFLDRNRGSLIVQFPTPVTASDYRWATANDAVERDPIRWTLDGSIDGTTWVTLDDRSQADQTVTTSRRTFVPDASTDPFVVNGPIFSLVDGVARTNFVPDVSAVVIAAGATLDLNGNTETVASLAGAATATVVNSSASVASTLTLAATSGSTTYNGAVTTGGTGGILNLTKTGASTLILNNPSPTYGATATINAGTLQLGDGAVVLTTLPANPIVNKGTVAINSPSGTLTSTALISGSGALSIQGAGTLAMTAANTYSGPTSISGVSKVNASGTGLGASTVTLDASGVVTAVGNLTLGGLAGAGVVHGGAFTLTVGGNNASTSFSGVIDGSGPAVGTSLIKVGSGSLTLGSNTYTGATEIDNGALVATTNASLGAGTAAIAAQQGGSLALSGTSFTFTKALTLAGAGVNGSGALKSVSGVTSATFAGTINVVADASIGADAGALTVTNNISLAAGVGNLTLTGSGNVVISGNISPAAPPPPPAYNYVGFTAATSSSAASAQGILYWVYNGATNIDYGNTVGGFYNTNTVPLTRNGGPVVGPSPLVATDGLLYLTDGKINETRSAFAKVTPSAFTSTFVFGFQNPVAEGFAFVLQNSPQGAQAIGGGGSGLGYAGMTPSLSAQFNLFNNVSQFGFGVNGVVNHPIDLLSYGLNFHKTNSSGFADVFQAEVTYTAEGEMTVTLRNLSTQGAPVTFSNAGTSAGIVKTGAGAATLAGNNTYKGTTTVSGGTLIVPSATALGSTSAVGVNSGGTLGVQGGVNLTVPITLKGQGAGGVGALNNISGTNTIAGPLTLAGGAAIGAAAGVLNLSSKLNLATIADVTFTGAGDINVAQAFGNGNNTVITNDALLQQWYQTAGVVRDENFLLGMGNNANGGLLSATPVGGNFLTSALLFPDLNTFNIASLAPTTGSTANFNNDFAFLWMGTFKAAKAGKYTFQVGSGTNGVDDEMTILIDLNNDGFFDNATEKVADTFGVGVGLGTSRISPTFAAGETHRIAIAFQEFGGGERGSAEFMTDGDPNFAAFTTIDPSDPNQAGMWTYTDGPLNNVFKTGPGKVTFMASNTYNGNTTVTGGTLATTANDALGSNPAATLTVSGATSVVNLFNSATAVTTVGTADFSAGAGTVNTGVLGGKLAIKSKLKLASGYTASGDMAAQGGNLVDNSAQRTLSVSGTLDLAKAPPAAINLPATQVSLTNGASLTINGAGDAVIGDVILTGSASIGPGANAPASLTVGSVSSAGAATLTFKTNIGMKLASGSAFKVDVNGATAGTLFDQAIVSGAVNLNGASLQITSGFTPAVGNTFTIIANDGADAVIGTFAGLPQGATVIGGTGTYTISYNGGDGNDVVLTAAAAGAATTTTLVATPLATTGGSSVMFTATVAPSPGTLGTVTFLDNGVAIPGGANIAVAGGVAVFSTTTLAVGTHPVTAAYSGAAGFGASASSVQNVVISSGATAPSVVSVTPNAGVAALSGSQHSRIVNLTVVFDQGVQLDNNAITLLLHTNNVTFGGTAMAAGVGVVPATPSVSASLDKKTWTMTFAADATTESGPDGLVSLKDGVYALTIDAAKVHPAGVAGTNMAANSTTVVHRLFGDIGDATQTGNDVTAVVNSGDNLPFRGAFNKTAGTAGYLACLDVNGDGVVNSIDNLQFRQRFNKALTWKV